MTTPDRYTFLDACGNEIEPGRHVVLIDRRLGLMIDVRDELIVKHRDASRKVATLDLLGHTDWRLQTPREMFSQLRHDATPYYDKTLFPNTRDDRFYWGGQVDPRDSGFAFSVGFNGGYASWSNRDSRGVVRAVRSIEEDK